MQKVDVKAPTTLVPVVGIGASAGGLEAITQLVDALSPELGLAYIVISHMDPRQESHMAEILAKHTVMPVCFADNNQQIQPDHIYVIPPDFLMTVCGNALQLTPRGQSGTKHLPVDALFTSLSEQRPTKAMGVVLSGTGSDGTQGVKEIKEAGGITIAQEPTSAAFDGMPSSAIQTGSVDLVLRPFEIANELAKIATHPYFVVDNDDELPAPMTADAAMEKIFELLSTVYQADFKQYKSNTIQRRLQRRMALVNETDVQSYLEVLHDNPVELAALYDDLLIRVTSFFREEAIYTALKQTVFPALLKNRSHENPLRIWVPACATGEEVYSLAICLLEHLGERAQDITIQIFGTDLNEAAIEQARQGSYAESIAERVSSARLQRYFVHENRRYRIAKQVRELCVFARQNVALDPPFSKMDLISCCNLLIYLDSGLQRRVLRHFHYALKPDGFLILGPAENADEDTQFFKRIENSQRMLYKRAMPARGSIEPVMSADPKKKTSKAPEPLHSVFLDNSQVQRKADGLLLSRFAPASILVDDRLNIVQFRGQTSPYLEHASGTASLNLHKVAHPGILLQLMPVIKEAQQTGATVFKSDLRIETPAGTREGTLEVIPLREPATKTSFCLILFDANSRPSKPEGRPDIPESDKDIRIRQLEEELESLRDYLHATNEAYEAALEESRSAQEELQSANEEFLSGNEELITAREELQASNEELTTANEELLSRTRELHLLNNELARARKEADFHAIYAESVIDTVFHPLLVLDQTLTIHRANHAFYDTFLTNPGTTLNRRLFELGDGEWDIAELRQLLEKVVTGQMPFGAFKTQNHFPNVGERTVMVNARKVPALDHRSARLLLAFDDVTLNEEKFHNLQADHQRKDEYIAMLAHELRNPLAPIRNAVELINKRSHDKNLQTPLDMIDRQVTTLTRLVNDLMDISRITRGQLLLERKPVLLGDLLKHVASSVTPYMEQRGHQLTVVIPEDLPLTVNGDGTRLEQVFNNLLNNAGKYTDRGGRISLTVSASETDAIIKVIDNGAGITSNILPHVFDLFVQSDATRTRAEGGLGIGLTLVRQIVQGHGGSVFAASNGAGQGSEFTVHLPLMNQATQIDEQEDSDADLPASFKARRVLVVDDNVDSANSISELIEMWGHEVTFAYDGFSGLEIARTFKPDVALLDIGLPGMSGHQLAVELKKVVDEDLFLIAMTGYGNKSDRDESKAAGFSVHMTKPVSMGSLQNLLSTLEAS
ncbi:MAG: response regulator [Gammaproteobacteria bacterium]|nr:MAG: response regulator [Gammaproteobacteria bacterium]